MITITGGAGFIGTRIGHLLEENIQDFNILDIRQSRSFPQKSRDVDIRIPAALENSLLGDSIIHLAAVHRDDVKDKSEYENTNVTGTQNICMAAEKAGINQIVFTSSVAVYGFAPADTDEAGAINPFNEYGRTKFEAERVLKEWQSKAPDDRSLIIVRPTVVFGEGNRGNVYNLLKNIASGAFVMIGNGTNKKSMAYVGNISLFLTKVMDSGPGVHIYNYVDKPDYDMNTLVSHVRGTLKGKPSVGPRLPYSIGYGAGMIADIAARVTNRTFPISKIRIKKFTSTTAFASAAHSYPGFSAPYTISEGIERTLNHEFLNPNPTAETFETE
ncbi:MAG: NAD-dependent epimerase/dehydratase family protein [Rhodothermales bacterium]